jgi:hypothetical protein
MNYQLHYDLLINKAQGAARVLLKSTDQNYIYYEKHHILPRCMGGSNVKSNMILLTPEEHFVAHLLLAKIHPTKSGLVCAAIRLTGKGNKYRKCNNKISGWLRRQHAINMRKLHIGIPKTKEHVAKVAKALTGRIVPQEQIDKAVAERKKNGSYVTSESTRLLRIQNRANQAHIHNVGVCMFGINYDTMKSALAELGVGRIYLVNRLKSDKFPDCYYL